jgi:hypothetical protein
MDEPSTPSARILLFRAAGRAHRADRAPLRSPAGRLPVETGRRFVYDVEPLGSGFAVTFEDSVITRHPDRSAAVANARLIAANFWRQGIPTLVRVIDPDGAIQPIVAFG